MQASSQQPPKQQEQNTQRPDSQQSERNPNEAREPKNGERQNWSYYKKRIKEYWDRFIDFADRRHDASIAIGTGFIALFTIVLAFATGFLWLSTRNLVIDAKQTAERQLRAYVFVQPTQTNITDDTISIRYVFQNTGQTPAYDVRHASKLEILPEPLPPGFKFVSPTNFIGGNSLGNGVPFGGEARVMFAGHPGSLKRESKRIYLVVIVKYIDTFKQERTTRMCASAANLDDMVQSIIDATAKGEKSGSFPNLEYQYPDQHNGSD